MTFFGVSRRASPACASAEPNNRLARCCWAPRGNSMRVTPTEPRWYEGCSLSLECQRVPEKYMARIPIRLLILGLLFTSPAVAQSSWLPPSDREYQYAIDSAFGKPEAGRD